MTAPDTIDLFAGPGGWSVAAATLGLRELGIELDPWACATRAAAGHLTVRADVAALPTTRMKGNIKRLIGSPPCGTFSAAGKSEGVGDLPLLHQTLDDLAAGHNTIDELTAACSDPRTPLVVQPLRYALDLRPEWVALEQVPAVLPLWQHIAHVLRTRGYSAWAGMLNAADYGVPQTRQRAILIASRIREIAPPEPTHTQTAEEATLFGPARVRWVSMAEALGWDTTRVVNTRGSRKTAGGNEFKADDPSWALTEKARSWTVRSSFGEPTNGTHERDPFTEPSHTLTEKTRSWVLRNGNQPNAAERDANEPAPTIAFGHNARFVQWMLRNNTQANSSTVAERPATALAATDRVAKPGHRDRAGGERRYENSARITIEEASVLQSFRPDYPWQGSKTRKFLQIGNAVPPLLALHVLAAATGIDLAASSRLASVHTQGVSPCPTATPF